MFNTFDIFDTLIGRFCYKGEFIFDIIENKQKLTNFKEKRMRYEEQYKSFDTLYYHLQNEYPEIDINIIKQYELDLELEMSFPINKYLNLVDKNDLLISDMYLNEEQIRELLNKHRSIKNNIFVSYAGKRDNIIWKSPELINNVKIHMGDNEISDYLNPLKNGIKSYKIDDTVLNQLENNFMSINPILAYSIRAVRNQLDDDYFSNIFSSFILPFTILICLKLNEIKKQNKINKLIFLSRDGYWFYHIYRILFDTDECYYVYFSRLSVQNNPDHFLKLFNSIEGNKLVFDLQGSGRTFNNLNLENVIYYLCFLSHDSLHNYFIFNIDNQSEIKMYIEDLFSAPHGSLENIIDNKYILQQPEYDVNILEPYTIGVQLFKKCYNTLNKYLSYHNDLTISNIILENLINNNINYLSKINEKIEHLNFHHIKYNKFPLKFYSQIEQDKYYIQNLSKFKLGGFFIEIGAYNGITGSNTFYLEKNLNWEGIVIECNPCLIQTLKKNRKCIICDKAMSFKSGELIDFLIPTGNEILGGKEQLSGARDYLKKQSLIDFSESYKSNKVIKVETISFNDLVNIYNITHIDYLSIDVEGMEFVILENINFNNIKIDFITVEHGNVFEYQQKIKILLLSKGYILHRNNKWDDEYIRQDFQII